MGKISARIKQIQTLGTYEILSVWDVHVHF